VSLHVVARAILGSMLDIVGKIDTVVLVGNDERLLGRVGETSTLCNVPMALEDRNGASRPRECVLGRSFNE